MSYEEEDVDRKKSELEELIEDPLGILLSQLGASPLRIISDIFIGKIARLEVELEELREDMRG